MPDRQLQREQTRQRVFEVLQRMRATGASLTRAARDAHTTPRTVRKHAASAVPQEANGRYRVTKSDRLARTVRFLTPDGGISVSVRGSRPASRIARHWAAVDRYLRTGNTDGLRDFTDKTFRVRGTTRSFVTDPALLDRLANAGEVSFEDLYARVA